MGIYIVFDFKKWTGRDLNFRITSNYL